MKKRFGADVHFLLVYIKEAHALDGEWPMTKEGYPLVEEPLNWEERQNVAKRCTQALKMEHWATVIDEVEDGVGKAYAAWPDRIYGVGKDGKVFYAGAPGPRGFSPNELEASLEKLLSDGKKSGGR